jgi:N6-adenosine-specific RNA methylase IME4
MKYRTIVADPPWRYTSSDIVTRGKAKTASVETRKIRAAENHYPTMGNEEIAALPVNEWADDSAHLYLWVTNPRLFRGRFEKMGPVDIIDAWGFEYVTLLTWHKLGAPGMGFYFRGDTEHVIFAKRGKAPIDPAIRVSNFIAAPRTHHSAKPDRFYEIVERVSPEPRLELFARRRRYGWDVWGDEAPTEQASQAEMGLEVA